MKAQGYGLPLRCPKCPPGTYFGMLKVPGNKAVPCPNCSTPLVSMRRLTPQDHKTQESLRE